MQGKIIRIISNLYTVLVDDKTYQCRARGKFRNENISPVVGDSVVIDQENCYIMEILPRRNELKRPVIANIDMALVTVSVKLPNLDLYLLDKLLTTIIYNEVEPVIVLTKLDLLENDEEIIKLAKYYENLGIKVVYNNDLAKLETVIKGRIVVLAGQSGAGKSTVLNRLDNTLDLKTTPISKALGRGVHTTRHVELYSIAGGLVADTPGFSSLEIDEMSNEEIKETFLEFKNYKCQYKDCNHKNEMTCGVKAALESGKILQSRYDNYLKFTSGVRK